MLKFGILFPLIILTFTRFNFKTWRVVKLFSQYVLLFGLWDLIYVYFPPPIYVFYPLLLIITLIEAGNLEHVINNDSNQSLAFIRFIFDPVFLKGSGITKRFFIRAGIIVIIAYLVSLIPLAVSYQTLSYMILLAMTLHLSIGKSSLYPDWAQDGWIFFNLRYFMGRGTKSETHLPKNVEYSSKLKLADEKYLQLIPQDLGQGKWFEQTEKRNVLLILVEGIGEHQLKNGWMPHLKKRSEANIKVETFISHQRNTNRGVYSVLSGKHPNMVSQIAKPDLIAQYGKMETGLPEFLNSKGYHSLFIQAAPTVFMSKDRFLPQLGFTEVVGEEHFPKEIPRIKWGIDDRSLYQIISSKLKTLKAPWFTTVLTVSTHHPFQASDRKLSNPEEAFRYADEALEEFLASLEKDGILDNTMVMITSDEASGDLSNFLTHNLGALTVMLPDRSQKKIETPIGQSDLAYSICDYLNFNDHPFHGRSLFRNYSTERPLYFANIFQQKAFCYKEGMVLIKNYTGKNEVLSIPKLSLSESYKTHSAEVSFEDFKQFIETNDRDVSFLTNPVIMDVKKLNSESAGGAIKTGLKAGDKIKLTFTGIHQAGKKPLTVLWLIQDMKNKRSFKLNQIMMPGISQKYEKTFESPEDAWYDLSVKVSAGDETGWEILDLQITLE